MSFCASVCLFILFDFESCLCAIDICKFPFYDTKKDAKEMQKLCDACFHSEDPIHESTKNMVRTRSCDRSISLPPFRSRLSFPSISPQVAIITPQYLPRRFYAVLSSILLFSKYFGRNGFVPCLASTQSRKCLHPGWLIG